MTRKVAVTGLGIVSPLGCSVDTVWNRLMNGESGIGPITYFDTTLFDAKIGGQVKEFDVDAFIPKKEQRRMDPFCHYGIAAAKMAVSDAGLEMEKEDPWRVGVMVSSGIGGLQVVEVQCNNFLQRGPSRFSPFMIPQMITNILSGRIAIEHGMKGPNFCVVSACASATHSIGESLRIIQSGDADVMLTGGAEAPVCVLSVGGFCAMRALSTRNDDPTRASRPFDRDRDGFVCAEGAGVLVLEEMEHARARGAKIYCELAGYGRTCDAYHITAPDEGAEAAAKGISLAVADAGMNPDQVEYINAHGTSTPLNDKGETLAIKKALGETAARKTMVGSTKSMTGHLLGAAGAVEAIFCSMALKKGQIPATINLENPDPACDLDYVPNTAREVPIKTALSNSLGFGGHNATVAFKAV
ncbi:MAG TPA: beta-ketoacyl-ACP synthase II [Kiritimatiellia bacterium]|nr:beta-ketoacyl-ACP synthase II [Kiritimatiellia bacterium]HNS80945.1 beta-ketoacyl-ACP synthase II [Kiritimatiellia bacterium]HPA78833.1 beta-ketoacyl-ACP synthase II [Kiritimatiellia bacterium]HQQ03973.1 beta-ketoacyl-ACP synthase II [Kiritimatiellia bacterium]